LAKPRPFTEFAYVGILAPNLRAIYGRQYNPILTLQALSFFDDLNEPLSEDVKAGLRAAIRSVSLQDLPAITAPQKIAANLERE
jgi:hypothetical protein